MNSRKASLIAALLAFCFSAHAQVSQAEGMRIAKDYVRQHGLAAFVEMQTAKVRENLPLKQSELEQVIGATYLRSTNTQIFKHLAVSDWRPRAAKLRGVSVDEAARLMPLLLRHHAITNSCSVPLTRFMLDKGLTIKHIYYEGAGRYLFTIDIREKRMWCLIIYQTSHL